MKSCKIEYVIFLCVILIFLVENIFLFFQINPVQSAPIERKSIHELVEHEPTKARIEMISMIESFKLNGEQLQTCYLSPVNKDDGEVKGDSLSIFKALGKYTILLRFSQYGCNTCVQEVLENMRQTFAGESDKCKILILTDKLTRYFLSYLEKTNREERINAYEIRQQTIVNGDDEIMPYIALVDSQGYILSALSFSPQSLVYVKYFNQMCKKKIEHE